MIQTETETIGKGDKGSVLKAYTQTKRTRIYEYLCCFCAEEGRCLSYDALHLVWLVRLMKCFPVLTQRAKQPKTHKCCYPKQLTIYNNCQKTIIKRLKSLMSRGNDFMEHLKYNNAKSLNKKTKNKQRARNHS